MVTTVAVAGAAATTAAAAAAAMAAAEAAVAAVAVIAMHHVAVPCFLGTNHKNRFPRLGIWLPDL